MSLAPTQSNRPVQYHLPRMPRRPHPPGENLGLLLLWSPVAATSVGLLYNWTVLFTLSIAVAGSFFASYALALGPWRRRAALIDRIGQSAVDLRSQLALPAPATPSDSAEAGDAAISMLRSAHEDAVGRMLAATRDVGMLRAVFDAAASPIIATNASGEVVLCNQAAEDFFDRRASLIGQSIEELFTQVDVLSMHAAARKGQPQSGQCRIQRPDGPRTFQVFAAPVPIPGSPTAPQSQATGVAVTLRDITELATAVQLKTDFVANASHELRTPLSSIKAAVDTLADGAWDDPSMRDRLTQMIAGNVTRLEEMVRDLLDLSRLESPEAPVQPEAVRVASVCDSLRDLFDGVLRERSLTLSFEADPAAEFITSDQRLFTLILKNLVDNATKFAYEGSTVRVVFTPDGSDLIIKVIDKGVGIPFGQQQRIFQRFFQVDPARSGAAQRRGTGLGLAIVKHAVKALGGTISVESVWKEGTTMTVVLPGAME
jgi:two-component system phosphate regulon sensor histidine kinase PhoR